MSDELPVQETQDEVLSGTAPSVATHHAAAGPAVPLPDHLSAVSPSRLAARTPPEVIKNISQEKWWIATQKVAFDWQATSAWADFWELKLVPPVQHGRGHELAGLIASAGEQLALALAAISEAELWNIARRDIPSEVRALDAMSRRSVDAAHEMAHRAMAELATHYLLAIGHTLANVTVRALALDRHLHPKLLDTLGSWYPVGSTNPKDWLSFSRDIVRQLRRVARQSSSPTIHGLVEPLTLLVMAPAWEQLDQLRGAHYHRRRPQSAGISGVPLTSPWQFTSGASHMNGGGDDYTDGDGLAHNTTNLARRSLSELITAMGGLLEQVQALVEEMGH